MSSAYTSFNTRVRAIVHRHDGTPVAFNGAVHGSALDGVAVTALTSSKALKGAGNFTVTVKAPRSYDFEREIRGGDWIVWWWEQNGRPYHGTLGIIMSVAKSKTSKAGATVIDYVLTCVDFATIFDRTQVWFDDFSEYESNVGGKVVGSRMGWTPTGSPDALIEAVLDAFLGRSGLIGGAWRMPASMRWIGSYFSEGLYLHASSSVRNGIPHVIGFGSSKTQLGGGVEVLLPGEEQILRGEVTGPEIALFSPKPGTVLSQHVDGLCNDLLNELHYDVLVHDHRGGHFSSPENPTPCVHARERPFVNAFQGLRSPWFRLPTVRVKTNERMVSLNTATNEAERINLIMLYASNLGWTQMDQYALFAPSYDRENVARHGIRKFERETQFVGVGKHGEGTWAEEIGVWHQLIASWYGPNHLWRSGSATIGGLLPEARPGHRLLIDDHDNAQREQFYIEEVTHTWRYPQGGSTTLGLTRGFRGTDRDLAGMVSERAGAFQREARGGAPQLTASPINSMPGRSLSP